MLHSQCLRSEWKQTRNTWRGEVKAKSAKLVGYYAVKTQWLLYVPPDLAEARGSVVVMALCYKPEGRGFDTR
jgi:hypothetical protein